MVTTKGMKKYEVRLNGKLLYKDVSLFKRVAKNLIKEGKYTLKEIK